MQRRVCWLGAMQNGQTYTCMYNKSDKCNEELPTSAVMKAMHAFARQLKAHLRESRKCHYWRWNKSAPDTLCSDQLSLARLHAAWINRLVILIAAWFIISASCSRMQLNNNILNIKHLMRAGRECEYACGNKIFKTWIIDRRTEWHWMREKDYHGWLHSNFQVAINYINMDGSMYTESGDMESSHEICCIKTLLVWFTRCNWHTRERCLNSFATSSAISRINNSF